MIQGTLLSANVGCFHPKGKNFTYSLFDPSLASMIGRKIQKEKDDICLIQEAWTFVDALFPRDFDEYEVLGLNDMIAVRKEFGYFEPGTYKCYSKRFIDPKTGLINHRGEGAYHGSTNPSEFGIPADFDVSSVIINVKQNRIQNNRQDEMEPRNATKEQNGTQNAEKILVVNVHVTSAPWNDERRAYEIREWIMKDAIAMANEKCGGNILIAGDFNEDETRNPKSKSSQAILELLNLPNMRDASNHSNESTTNYPIIKRKLDHMMGTAQFSDFRIEQPLLIEDIKLFKKKHKLSWMYIDHRSITAKFHFESQKAQK